MKFQNIAISLFAVMLVVIGSLWFLQNYELKEIDDYSGYKGEARSNDLFAARLFLKRMGIPASREDGLPTLPDTDTVIVLDTQRFTFSESKTQRLLDWVSQGGHLLTRARVDINTADEVDENKPETEDRDKLQRVLGIKIGGHVMVDEEDLPIQVKLDNAPTALGLNLDFFNELLPEEPAKQQQHDGKSWLIQQSHGKGLITVASTLEFIENHQLDKADHATLFWYLLRSHNPDFKQVWLVNQDTMPSLSTLLAQHAWAVLLSVAALLAFIFWALMPRFGALIPEPALERRRILEHIKASGQFLWKQRTPDPTTGQNAETSGQHTGQAPLLNSTRQAIRQSARTHIPGWQWLDNQQQVETLAHYLRWPAEQQPALEQLLTAPRLDEAAFVRLVQLANTLRKTT